MKSSCRQFLLGAIGQARATENHARISVDMAGIESLSRAFGNKVGKDIAVVPSPFKGIDSRFSVL